MMNILILEDDEFIRRLIKEEIESAGHCALEAATIEQAILYLGNADVVLVDLHLPDGHGFDFMARLAAKRNDLPAIVVSGYPEDKKRAPALPIVSWLDKPFGIPELRAQLSKGCKAAEVIEDLRHHSTRLSRLVE